MPFTPSDAGTLKFWLSPDTIVEAIGAFFSTWNDASGNSRTFTGGGTVMRGPNNRKILRFDITSRLERNEAGLIASGGATVFVVGSFYQIADARTIFDTGNFGSDSQHGAFITALNTITATTFSGSGLITVPMASWLDRTFQVFTFKFGGASSMVRVDGRNAVTGTLDVGTASASFMAFSTNSFSTALREEDFIGEIICYSSALSDANCALVERYLKDRWAMDFWRSGFVSG